MEIYGYARVSSKKQNPDRQVEQLHDVGLDDRHIFIDLESGKDFNRMNYNLLVGTPDTVPLLRIGDLLIITSLDRLGRNYIEMQQQWKHLIHNLGVDIQVLDMPLLDTRQVNNSLDKAFISDLVLQILCYVAEKERENTKRRQKEGIDLAKRNGVQLGRPTIEFPDSWDNVYKDWKSGKVTAVKAMEILDLRRSTFYKLAKEYAK